MNDHLNGPLNGSTNVRHKFQETLKLFKKALQSWSDDNVSIHGAALAYYTIFSVAPLLIIAIGLAGLFFGAQASKGEIFSAIQGLVGPMGAKSIENLVSSAAQKPHVGKLAAAVGFVTLGVGATGVFQQLQQSLNIIWRVSTKPGKGIWVFIRRRLLTFSMVVVIGFILLVTLLVSAAIAALGQFLGGRLPGGEVFWHLAHSLISFGVSVVLFAAILKILPDVKLAWRDVWLASGVTAFFFTVGRLLIGLYLGHSGVASTYGAAGSLIVVLLWVFYASQILFFGAELTRSYTLYYGKKVSAKAGSELITETEPKKPGQDRPAA